jgi:hypothetical protein
MTHTATKSDFQISLLDNMALREEIGERLRSDLDPCRQEMPMHLLQLMKRFERVA